MESTPIGTGSHPKSEHKIHRVEILDEGASSVECLERLSFKLGASEALKSSSRGFKE